MQVQLAFLVRQHIRATAPKPAAGQTFMAVNVHATIHSVNLWHGLRRLTAYQYARAAWRWPWGLLLSFFSADVAGPACPP